MTITATTMRAQMRYTLEDLAATDPRLMILLADISVDYFQQLQQRYPERVHNLGILEQTLIGTGAGIAMEGFIPVMHSIAPFLVERPFEQIKLDFCYQGLPGNFISIGASYDYSTEGMTHHGTGDVQILRSLPGMQIVVPGTATEFDHLFRAMYANGSPTYYRLSEHENPTDHPVEAGKLTVVKQGRQATVVAVGPMLRHVLPAVADLDVTVLYCTTVAPFDSETLRHYAHQNIILVEPYYSGGLSADISATLKHMPIRLEAIGVPHTLPTRYGSSEQHDAANGLTPEEIRRTILSFLSQ
ncbi:transketolase family protein [Dictyobacter aurantiacus]|uniref:1-deoxy-D-xylulose-5-phosphate synthase n=1 Tax=Dictyobacter aurantiacus TaxID=1936993 RepID=A0A401ZS31_9CHLR|nr:transketolase C-terminal domain-containing protein [Dictyobacter aurantiacus]GCE09612.1 transketolase [Dictyobacter aurantiacus]